MKPASQGGVSLTFVGASQKHEIKEGLQVFWKKTEVSVLAVEAVTENNASGVLARSAKGTP